MGVKSFVDNMIAKTVVRIFSKVAPEASQLDPQLESRELSLESESSVSQTLLRKRTSMGSLSSVDSAPPLSVSRESFGYQGLGIWKLQTVSQIIQTTKLDPEVQSAAPMIPLWKVILLVLIAILAEYEKNFHEEYLKGADAEIPEPLALPEPTPIPMLEFVEDPACCAVALVSTDTKKSTRKQPKSQRHENKPWEADDYSLINALGFLLLLL